MRLVERWMPTSIPLESHTVLYSENPGFGSSTFWPSFARTFHVHHRINNTTETSIRYWCLKERVAGVLRTANAISRAWEHPLVSRTSFIS